jgi:hypothetical protein
MNKSIFAMARSLLFTFLVAGGLTLSAVPDGWAQQRTTISFNASAENSKYTQQHELDVGDMPGHVIRLFEIQRTFAQDPPVFAGVRAKDSITRGQTDLVGTNGSVIAYTVFNMENGDKIFGRYQGTAQGTVGESSGKRTVVGNLLLTGGTGKLRGIHGTLHVTTVANPSKGLNETKFEGEYWMEIK